MTQFEYVKNIRNESGETFKVSVSKVGGGTVGNKYLNEYWDVVITDSDGVTVWNTMGFRSRGMYIGGRVGHETAAYIAFDWFVDGDEDDL